VESLDDDINWKALFFRVGRELYISMITEKEEWVKERGFVEDFESEHAYVTHTHYDPLIRELLGRHCLSRNSFFVWNGQNPEPEFVKNLDKEFGYYVEGEWSNDH
jgi:hypothetical protein